METTFTEHTGRLVDINADRNHQRQLAKKYKSKYDDIVNEIRDDYHEDTTTMKAKYSDNAYELARYMDNSMFYANLRNGFLVLIIITLLLRMNVIAPIVAYTIGGVVTIIMCVYTWSSVTYQETQRSGVVFNDYVPGRAMDQPPAVDTCS